MKCHLTDLGCPADRDHLRGQGYQMRLEHHCCHSPRLSPEVLVDPAVQPALVVQPAPADLFPPVVPGDHQMGL